MPRSASRAPSGAKKNLIATTPKSKTATMPSNERRSQNLIATKTPLAVRRTFSLHFGIFSPIRSRNFGIRDTRHWSVLLSGGHEEADRRAAVGARIEFRSAGRQRGGRAHSECRNCDRAEQSRGGAGNRKGARARHPGTGDSFQG